MRSSNGSRHSSADARIDRSLPDRLGVPTLTRMHMIETWLPLLLFGCALALWMTALRARERAVGIVRQLCERADVQLLDQSVALRSFKFTRIDGRLALLRRYGFEVSVDGQDRHRGHVDIKGHTAEHWSLPWTAKDDPRRTIDGGTSTPLRPNIRLIDIQPRE